MTLLSGVCKNTKEDIKKLLFEFSDTDYDFNGKNGYVSEEATSAGFNSDQEFAWSKANVKDTAEAIINEFIRLWLYSDPYYERHRTDVHFVPDSDYLSISVAYTTSD